MGGQARLRHNFQMEPPCPNSSAAAQEVSISNDAIFSHGIISEIAVPDLPPDDMCMYFSTVRSRN